MAEPRSGPAPPAPDATRPRWTARRAAKPALAVVGAVVVALWLLAVLGMGSVPRNGAFDDSARGLSLLTQGLAGEDIRVQSLATGPHAIDAAEHPERSVLLVAGVERAYSAGEVEAVRAFVERGGTVFVADDFGFGDQVGALYGLTFDKRPLRDANYDRNVSLVKVNATLAGQNASFILNVPASLGSAAGANVTALARSGSDSYIDENLDGIEDPGDIKGPFLVLALVTSGQGKALFASDPGLLANDLASDNGPFLQRLFKTLLPDGGTVYVDESRHGQGAGAPLAALLAGEVQLTSEPAIASGAGLALLLLAAAAYAASPRTEDISAHASTLDARAHRDSPELTAKRLQRLARRAAEQRSGLTPEQVEQASPQQLAAHLPDPVVKALLLGEPTKGEPSELLRKVQALGARRGDGGAP